MHQSTYTLILVCIYNVLCLSAIKSLTVNNWNYIVGSADPRAQRLYMRHWTSGGQSGFPTLRLNLQPTAAGPAGFVSTTPYLGLQ